eukprot:CAMPEP_0178994180 /NCGR_PEP_ID=MMETSP0795-20121207/7129_1 /TAXON_ID=88552 /ORGANISM="Amoebophrya sp., Strain Ameob2" /LENGTH=464 /DNA_ID=CAMNT_0020686349 /DNA_START=64 /DNA_END=1458 /DNA_ORIENTATION=-
MFAEVEPHLAAAAVSAPESRHVVRPGGAGVPPSETTAASTHTSSSTPLSDFFSGFLAVFTTTTSTETATTSAPAWAGPWEITVATIVFFSIVRLWLGGAPYLCSAAWYGFCLMIPFPFLFFGIGLGGVCVPFQFDLPTAFHCVLVLVYCQVDLFVARFMVRREFPAEQEERQSKFGSINVLKIMADNLHPLKPRTPLDMGAPALLRGVFEFNGALMHEVYWNVFICQNFLKHQYSEPVAILLVPVLSCLVHGIVCNYVSGYRCFPQFLWVVLAYHASGGSVLIPGLVHATWYFMDGRLLCVLNIFKQEWDVDTRKNETRTPHADKYWLASIGLICAFYAGVVYAVVPALEKATMRRWTSTLPHEASAEADTCHYNSFSIYPFGAHTRLLSFDTFLVYASFLQILFGALTWRMVRSGMDVIEISGELTKSSKQEWADLMQAELETTRMPLLKRFLGRRENYAPLL